MCIILGSSVDGILRVRPITSGIFQRRTNLPAEAGQQVYNYYNI